MDFSSEGKIEDYSFYDLPFRCYFSLLEAAYLWCGKHPPRYSPAYKKTTFEQLLNKIRREMPIDVLAVFDLFVGTIEDVHSRCINLEKGVYISFSGPKGEGHLFDKKNELESAVVHRMFDTSSVKANLTVREQIKMIQEFNYENCKIFDRYKDVNDLLGVMLFEDLFTLGTLGNIAEHYDAKPLAFFPELRQTIVSQTNGRIERNPASQTIENPKGGRERSVSDRTTYQGKINWLHDQVKTIFPAIRENNHKANIKDLKSDNRFLQARKNSELTPKEWPADKTLRDWVRPLKKIALPKTKKA
jgi:hypothetical protein